MKAFTTTLIFALFTLLAFASQPLVRNFTRKDYKSGTQNWSITQDKQNKMYFANNNGLLVFDGKNWAVTPIKNGTNVRSILYDGESKFYVSTFNEFGYFQMNKEGIMQYYSLSESLNIKPSGSNELYNIYKDEKLIYFQGEKNVYVYDQKVVKKFEFGYKIDASSIVHNILFVSSKQSGLFMLNGDLFVRVQGSEILINKKVSAILPFANNQVLITTSFDGVFLYNGLTIVPFWTGADAFLKANQVFCATTNGRQIVYGTVQRGIVIQNIADGSINFVNTYTGLQNNTVLSASFDNQQNLWLGLDNGIDYVMLNSPIRNIFGTNNLFGAGYTSHLKDKILYFGTNQGLYSTSFPLPTNDKPLQLNLIKGMEGQVWCLNEIDNTLFCGDDQGAFIISKNSVERIQGLSGTWTFKALRKHPNVILGCSYQGLFILKKTSGKWRLSHFLKGGFNESSPMFEEDNDGSIWFSHWLRGLYRLTLNANLDSIIQYKLYNSKNGLPYDRTNTVFRVDNNLVFSSSKGFYSFNSKTNTFNPNVKWNSLFGNSASDIRLHESPNGDVWCASGRFIGIARKDKNNNYAIDSLTYRILQPKIIIGFEHFNVIDNNNLIFSNEDGFSWINTTKRANDKPNFKVLLTSIIASNSNFSETQSQHFLPNVSAKASIKNSHNSVRFEFVAPEYRNEGLVEYSYMLENYDKSWSEFSSQNMKEYNKLPRGNYVFKVKARSLLEKNSVTCSYEFTILPAWYESTLAFIIYIIIILIAIGEVIIWVNKKSTKGARDMEQLKEKEIQEQKKVFEAENQAKKKEIKELKNQQLQYELRHKAQELASSTMNLIRKNEMLADIMGNITKATEEIKKNGDVNAVLTRLGKMERNIKQNIEQDKNWKRFEENFDLVYENYLKRLGESYPELNMSDKKICAYIKMDLSSKDMAPLLNMSVRSIETNRYRIRQKLSLGRDVNLSDFLQKF
ncbi:MAG: triple tyrosine motif-containing protein [Paludibacter sp.]